MKESQETLETSWNVVQKIGKKRKLFILAGILCVILLVAVWLVAMRLSATTTSMTLPTDKTQYTDTSVATLDKEGDALKNTYVHLVNVKIIGFVKDDSGSVVGANVMDNGSYTAIAQVIFPTGTDIAQINTGDTIEVWAGDDGAFSGKNAFGATVYEVAVLAGYLTDTTSGYTE